MSGDIDFTMPDNRDEAISLLSKMFPQETQAIQKYFNLIEKLSNEFFRLSKASWWEYALFPFIFRNILHYRTTSVKQALDKMMHDNTLKLLLNTNVGYYNDTIKDFSFFYHAIAQHSYFEGGGWYIKGGSSNLSNYLASIIEKNGGEIITKANVIKIEHKDKQTHAISYMHKKEKKELQSDLIISNIDPSSTYKLANIDYQEKKKVATSLLSMYIGFKTNIKSVYGKRAYSTFLMPNITSIEAYDTHIQEDLTNRAIVFVDYSQVDSALTEDPSKSFGVICTTDYLEDWEHLDKEAYTQKKQEITESYLDRLETQYPNIREHIEFTEIGTAKTMQRYLKTPNGTAYGFAPYNDQFFRIPEIKSKKLNNLYFVGAWVISGGFTPAILSGDMCYQKIIKEK